MDVSGDAEQVAGGRITTLIRFGLSPKPTRVSAQAIRALLLLFAVVVLRSHPGRRAIRPQAPIITVHYYDVEGVNASQIWASIRAVGPHDHEGQKMSALTNWYIDWRWPVSAAGACDLSLATLSFRAVIQMPHLLHPEQLSPDLRAAWQHFVAALRAHEDGHVRHALDNMDDVGRALRAGTCANANAAGENAIRILGNFDNSYDAATHHGVTQGATFPTE